MERLISLFREASDDARGRPPDLPPDAQPGLGGQQPLYFVQLMEYLRQQKAEAERAADGGDDVDGEDVRGFDDGDEAILFDEDADMLIGACDAHR
jgi:hypothetical protein